MLHYHGCEEEIMTFSKWHAMTVGHLVLAVLALSGTIALIVYLWRVGDAR